jgi:hypothetical protein
VEPSQNKEVGETVKLNTFNNRYTVGSRGRANLKNDDRNWYSHAADNSLSPDTSNTNAGNLSRPTKQGGVPGLTLGSILIKSKTIVSSPGLHSQYPFSNCEVEIQSSAFRSTPSPSFPPCSPLFLSSAHCLVRC